MKAAYCFLRTVEHRLQMVNDEQTQTLPADRDGLERFARFLGYARRATLSPKLLLDHLETVQRHYARLFEKTPAADRPALAVSGRCRRPQDAGAACRTRLPRAARGIRHHPAMARRQPSLAAAVT